MYLQNDPAIFSGRPGNRRTARQNVFCPGNCFIVCVQIAQGRVADAWSAGRMMRNMNLILRDGVDEHGRPCFARNAHCLCNDGHALAAVRALENLAGVAVPRSALLVRSLVQALRCTQAHLLHFYQFNLSNWICLDRALGADPCKAVRLAEHCDQKAQYFRQSQKRLQGLAESRARNVLSNGFCDHPEYLGPDEFHLLVYSNSLASLRIQVLLNTALGLLGCKNGTYAAFQMGGLPTDLDLGPDVLQQLRGLLFQCRDFVCTTFLKDLELVVRIYSHWKDLAAGTAFLTLGDFVRPHDRGLLFPDGIIGLAEKNRQENCQAYLQIAPARTDLVWEDIKPQWDRPDRKHYGLNFGKNGPVFHWARGDFHWLSAPRHGNDACEVGPLARVMGAFAQGRQAVVKAVNVSLNDCGLLPRDMNSTLGRLLSRGIEAAVLAGTALDWLDELERALSRKNSTISKNICLPASGVGTGTVEVSRGALTHTICLEKNRIVRHDCLIPSLWNFSPRDSDGRRGPLEQALLGAQVIDPGYPLEILRIVHAFDPCSPCHVVVKDLDTGWNTLVEG